MTPPEVMRARSTTPPNVRITPHRRRDLTTGLRKLSDTTPKQKKNSLVERSIYQWQSPLSRYDLSTNIGESKSVEAKRQTLKLRGSGSSTDASKQESTPLHSPIMSGWLRIRSGDEKATISRIWEALGLPEDERQYAWSVLKCNVAAQKAYGERLRVVLSFKKEYTDLLSQRHQTVHNFLALLNERNSKASLNFRKHIAELVLQIRSLTSKITHVLEKTRAYCRLPLNLPHFSTSHIDQAASDLWYARLLTENILNKEVMSKLLLIIGFFDDPENGEFVKKDVVIEAVEAFYHQATQFGVWICPPEEERAMANAEQTGMFAADDASLFILLGLPILTLKRMDFATFPKMLSNFLETASGAPEMPLTSEEIKQLLISEGHRIMAFRALADKYANQKKGIVIVPIQALEDGDQYELYPIKDQHSDGPGLFTRYHLPTDGSVMPKKALGRRRSTHF